MNWNSHNASNEEVLGPCTGLEIELVSSQQGNFDQDETYCTFSKPISSLWQQGRHLKNPRIVFHFLPLPRKLNS